MGIIGIEGQRLRRIGGSNLTGWARRGDAIGAGAYLREELRNDLLEAFYNHWARRRGALVCPYPLVIRELAGKFHATLGCRGPELRIPVTQGSPRKGLEALYTCDFA